MSRPELLNGALMPSIYDDVFKHLAYDTEDYTGDAETVGWTATRISVDRASIAHAAQAVGNPRATEAGAIDPGHYIAVIDDQGLIWAFFYGTNVDLLNEDFAEASELYERLEGYTDDVIEDLDENGNVIEPDEDEDESVILQFPGFPPIKSAGPVIEARECSHRDCGYGECSGRWMGDACETHHNGEGRCQLKKVGE